MMAIDDILIRREDTIRASLDRMNRSGRTVLLLVDDDQRLLRTVTDGDLRRLLLEASLVGVGEEELAGLLRQENDALRQEREEQERQSEPGDDR